MGANPLVKSDWRYDSGSGSFVSAKHQRIAEIINDYNSELSLVWIPPKDRNAADPNEKPYALLHSPAFSLPYIAFYISEDELDERVLARIFYNDMSKTKPADFMTMLEAADAAEEILRQKEAEDSMAEAKDLAATVLKSPLHTFKHNGKRYE